MTFWLRFNRAVYGAYYRLRHRNRGGSGGSVAPPAKDGRDLLFLAWGRIGDTVLTTGILKHFRAAFPGRRIVCAGRPKIDAIVAPHVDEFLPFGADLPTRLARPWEAVLTDIHFFYGGVHAMKGLLEALPAGRKITYEGFHLSGGLAPVRIYPEGFDVVRALPKAEPHWHLLLDNEHYFREATRLVLGEAYAAGDFRPALVAPEPGPVLARFGLEREGYVAWQSSSNNPKKDYASPKWAAILARFKDTRFVALGDPGGPTAPNVIDLRGKADIPEAMAIIAGARAFLGPDSGLTHIAACLGKPTVVVAHDANLGHFFPYPESYGYENLTTVDNPRYRGCARCFMTCSKEPIVMTYFLGHKCLRELPPEPVIQALEARLAAVPALSGTGAP